MMPYLDRMNTAPTTIFVRDKAETKKGGKHARSSRNKSKMISGNKV